MRDPIVIVSIAPWTRRSAWWRAATLAQREGLLDPTCALLVRYFQAGGDESGAVSLGEATILRAWATTVTGWRERAERGQHPLRFATLSSPPAARAAT